MNIVNESSMLLINMNLVFLVLFVVLVIVWFNTRGTSGLTAGTLRFFGGSNPSYLSYPSTASLYPGTNSFTLEAWVKQDPTVVTTENTAPRPFVLSGLSSGSGLQILGCSIEGDSTSRTLYVWINGDAAVETEYPTDNKWHHLAIVGETGTKVSVYIDGIRQQQEVFSYNIINPLAVTSKTFNVGSYPQDPVPSITSFLGYLANVRYNTTTAFYVDPTFPVPTTAPTNVSGTALLLLAATEATAFTDSSTNGLTATANGSVVPAWSSQTLTV